MRLDLDMATIDTLPADELPAVLSKLLAFQAAAISRMASEQREQGAQPDLLVKVSEAAEMLNKSQQWLYRHADDLPFTRRVGGSLRFSAAGIKRWIEHARP